MRWAALILASIAFSLLARLLTPLLPLFAQDRYGPINNNNGFATEPRLPRWLLWFDTPDNGLLGDQGHKDRWAGKSRYLQMTAWLWRNCAYGFSIEVLGAAVSPFAPVKVKGDVWIKNRDHGKAGWYWLTIGRYWNFKWIVRVGTARCFMLELGWKLQDYGKNPTYRSAKKAAIVLSPRVTDFYPVG